MERDEKTAVPYSSLPFHADTMPSLRHYSVTKPRPGSETFDMETYQGGVKRHSLVEPGHGYFNDRLRVAEPVQKPNNGVQEVPVPQLARRVSGTRKQSTAGKNRQVLDSPEEITRRASVLQQEGRENEAFNDDEIYDEVSRKVSTFSNRNEGILEGDRDDDDKVPDLPTLLLSPHKISTTRASRKISVGYDPTEVVPSKLNYEIHADDHHVRPTLEDLRVEKQPTVDDVVRNTGNESKLKRGNLGWIRGVVLWSILNLWGVMLFLRMSWMNAQAGMGLFLLIVLLGTVIALLTSLSTSAISTNGEVGVGGTYYMISRSLGPQFGAAIGVIFSLANAISVALNIQGFADVIRGLLAEHNLRMVDSLNDIRIIGIITLVALTGFTFFGMEIAAKLQIVFFIIISASILNIVIGSIIPPSVEDQAKGFVGYSNALFEENFYPAFQKDQFGENSFMSVFGVFFPSVTGILAGTSITGDLRDPSGAIPKGTICAILFTTVSYILVGWCSAAVTLRHASGNVQDFLMGNLTACQSGSPAVYVYDASTACKQGSINNMEIVEVVGHFRPLILAGIFASTLSTALGCINFAPKIFQALCRDDIFPFIHIFGKGYGKADEPYRAYGLVMIIAIVFLIPSDLNFISNVVSNCFLLTYALVNYATFDAAFSKSPGWRPTFKFYNKWLSLFTAVACFILMFFLDWMSAVIASGLAFVLWIFVYYRKPQVNWGTSAQANSYRSALTDMLHLLKIEDHVKNFRPQILLLSGLPCTRPALVYVANSITRGAGLLICGHVSVGKSVKERGIMSQESYRWLRRRKIRAFYDFVATKSTAEGIRALIQTSGLGKMRPNIIMMGFLNSWRTCNETSVDEYVGAINEAFDANLGVIILCIKEGCDITSAINFEKLVSENAAESHTMESMGDVSDHHAAAPLELLSNITDPVLLDRITAAERFLPAKKKHMAGHIAIWWLYDDGGLTILIPYLMSQKGIWHHCPIKLYCLAGKDPEVAQKDMLSLLDKFRITVQEVIPIDLDSPPNSLSVKWFHDMIGELRDREPVPKRKMSGLPVIKDSDLFNFGHRTLRQIRLRELLLEHSKADTCLNVVTMPLPKSSQSSTFFLSVLHSLTDSLPPTLLIRGSQENVLTYYC